MKWEQFFSDINIYPITEWYCEISIAATAPYAPIIGTRKYSNKRLTIKTNKLR